MNNSRYPYHYYKLLRNLDNSGRITWATKVKNILLKYGFGYAWVIENAGDENLLLKTFKQRLLDCCKQEWHEKVFFESSKAFYYRHFMTELTIANYIFYRITLSRLCCSVHKLHIEIGRRDNISTEDRICYVCDSHDAKDEYQFIMNFSAYDNLRNLYLPYLSNLHKIVSLFNRLMNADERTTKNLAMYI